MEIVYAKGSAVVALPEGGTVHVAKGTHWPADDPVVKAQASLFSVDARFGLNFSRTPAGYDAPVEEATANPGDKRNRRG